MKLIVLTAVKAFEGRVKKLLEDNQVFSYSYFPVSGHWNRKNGSQGQSWFGTDLSHVDSLLFLAFVPMPLADVVHEAVEESNKTCEVKSRIHLAVIPVERSNFTVQQHAP